MQKFSTIRDLIANGGEGDYHSDRPGVGEHSIWTITAIEGQGINRIVTVTEVASGPVYREVGTGELGFNVQRQYRPRQYGTQHITRTFKAQPADTDQIAYRLASTPEITHQEVITD